MAILRLESSAFDEPFLCQSRKQPPKHIERRIQERLYSPGRLKKELRYRNIEEFHANLLSGIKFYIIRLFLR